MTRWAVGCTAFVACVALCLFPIGCGGGSGNLPTPPGVTVGDLGGAWFGPFGMTTMMGTTVGTGSAGMMVMPGAASDTMGGWTAGTGGLLGITGTITLRTTQLPPNAAAVFEFVTDPGDGMKEGYLVLAEDRNHVLYIDESLRIGAFQRDGTALAPPYTSMDLVDVAGTAWANFSAGLDAMGEPIDAQGFASQIDMTGEFTSTDSMGTMSPPGMALGVLEMANGQYAGPFTADGGAKTGTLLLLMTPDRQFLAGLHCWAAPPEGCRISIWARN
jgi:hypothetical protein